MATHKGSEGVVKVGANTVAEVTGWSLDITAETIDDSQLSDTWKTFLADQQSWTASIDAHWDETDTTGQGAMTIGSSITLNLFGEGATTGDTYWTGTALITGISRSASIGSVISASFSLQGSGALTETTV